MKINSYYSPNCNKKKRPFNLFILPKSFILFLKTLIFNPILFLKCLRWVHTIYFVAAYLKKKRIKKIISFTDYNEFFVFLKKILDNNLTVISIQNSRRDERLKYFTYDKTLSLYPLNNIEKSKLDLDKIYNFGSLRLLLEIEKISKLRLRRKIRCTDL